MLKELLNIVKIDDSKIGKKLEPEICYYPKGSSITAQNTVEDYIYFILKGSVKVSYFKEISEYILDFWFEGDFVTSYVSFIQRKPSLTQITALNEVKAERIHHSQLELLYQQSPGGNEIGRKMAERMYIHKTMKEIELVSLTAEQRYLKLLEKSKTLVQEVSVKDMASYLGIHPESLSRIRRKIIS